MKDIREQNRLANLYRREATQLGIVSPFRQGEYINARLRGLSQEKALKVASDKSSHR